MNLENSIGEQPDDAAYYDGDGHTNHDEHRRTSRSISSIISELQRAEYCPSVNRDTAAVTQSPLARYLVVRLVVRVLVGGGGHV